jgi:thiol-disulfide isomerase/thioredoxin
MTRRNVLLGSGVALASAAAGLGLWRALNPPPPALSQAEQALWALSFERPQGGTLHLKEALGQPLLLNFWATWCPPCIKEMPLLDAFARQHQTKGWRVMGLAVDGPTPVREFLARQPVSFGIGLAGLTGVELSRSLGNAQGGLPFTVVFNRQGRLVQRKTGTVTEADLAAWVR